MFDSFPNLTPVARQSLDGIQPIHPVLKSAIQDPTTPPEVKAVIVDLQTLDPVEAALEARLFVRALRADDLDSESRVARRRAFRQAFNDWKTSLRHEIRVMSAEKLAQVCDEWADAELAEVI